MKAKQLCAIALMAVTLWGALRDRGYGDHQVIVSPDGACIKTTFELDRDNDGQPDQSPLSEAIHSANGGEIPGSNMQFPGWNTITVGIDQTMVPSPVRVANFNLPSVEVIFVVPVASVNFQYSSKTVGATVVAKDAGGNTVDSVTLSNNQSPGVFDTFDLASLDSGGAGNIITKLVFTAPSGSIAIDDIENCRLLVCPCELFTTTDFGQPMGKKKNLGATMPVKFQLFFDGQEILGEDQLNAVLAQYGCQPDCPHIRIFDVTGQANVNLPEDQSQENVGDPDEGDCFRFSDGNWIYNLKLTAPLFSSGGEYLVEVEIGDCVLTPGNSLFEIK